MRFETQVLTRGERWAGNLRPWQAGLLAWLWSCFWASPYFRLWHWSNILQTRAADYLARCAHPLTSHLAEPILAYRPTLPVIAHVLHLPPTAALALPFVANILFLAACYKLLLRCCGAVTALGGALILSCSWCLFQSNWMPGEVSDPVSHLFAVCLLLSKNPFTSILCLLGGLLNDERMILCLPFAMCWHFPPRFELTWLKAAAGWLVAIFAGLGIYLVIRHALQVGWIGPGVPTPKIYGEIFKKSAGWQPFSDTWWSWSAKVAICYRWGWIIVILYASRLLASSRIFPAAILVGSLVAGALASAFVIDVERSVGYLCTAWLVAIAGLYLQDSRGTTQLVFRVVLAMTITPVFSVSQNLHMLWDRPFFLY